MHSYRSRGVFLLTVLALFIATPPSHSAASVLEGTVVKVADGDTITVLDSNRQQHRVRLAGIDAPEKGQPFSNASRKRLSELLAGKQGRVEFTKYDRYGRIVGKAWVTPLDCPRCGKTLDVGLAQVTMGMAWWYRYYAHEQSPEDQARYEFAEREARTKNAGLWRDKNPEPPWEWRRAQRER
jgi:endonuclease YncB( thermonuclease family)